MEDLVTIAEMEGHRVSYVASILESHGLTVLIKDENTSSMLPNLPSYWYKAPHSKNQVVKAQEALQAIPPESDDPESIELEE